MLVAVVVAIDGGAPAEKIDSPHTVHVKLQSLRLRLCSLLQLSIHPSIRPSCIIIIIIISPFEVAVLVDLSASVTRSSEIVRTGQQLTLAVLYASCQSVSKVTSK